MPELSARFQKCGVERIGRSNNKRFIPGGIVMLTKLDRLKGYSARETCVALLSMLAIPLFASAIAVAQTPIVASQQFWGANDTNSAATFVNTTVATVGGNWGSASPGD